jgi:hypothetical protein
VGDIFLDLDEEKILYGYHFGELLLPKSTNGHPSLFKKYFH